MAFDQPHRHERVVNHVPNVTLSSAILSSDTAIPCSDTANLPDNGNFRVQIGSEILEIETNNTSNNTLTASSRGAESTSAAGHAEGAEVFPVCTEQTLDLKFLENSDSACFSQSGSIEAVPNNRFQNNAGNLWTTANFSWVNQGSATVVDSGTGGFYFTLPSEASWNHRGIFRAVPTKPYRIRCKVRFGPGAKPWDGAEGAIISLGCRQSGTGELEGLGVRLGENMAVWQWSSPTAYNGVVDSAQTCTFCDDAIWLQFRETASERQYYSSHDGNSWTRAGNAFWQTGRTSFLTADQMGVFVNSANSAAGAMFHIESFVVETET